MPITIDSPYEMDVSTNDINTIIKVDVKLPDQEEEASPSEDISSNDQIILSTISDIKSLIEDRLPDNEEVTPELTLYAVGLRGANNAPMNGYYCMYGSEFIYIPFDKVEYLTLKNDQVINLSSQTINCYSFDSSGNTVNQFRINSFGSFQKYTYYQNQYNSWWQWDDVYITSEGSNITYGQTGIHTWEGIALFGILLFTAVIAIFRRGV